MTGDRGKLNLGQALSNMMGDAVHRAASALLPHAHAERVRHTMAAMEEVGNKTLEMVTPLAAEMLDTGKVHPLLTPLFETLAGRR